MDLYEEFLKRVQDIHRMQALQGHLGWDQEVLMPSKGAASRGEMMAWLAGQRHQLLTDARTGELLDALEKANLDLDQTANVREMRRSYDQAVRLPKRFVETFAQARSEALVAWQDARKASDFEAFKPALTRLIELTHEKIAYLGVSSTPYDVLLDEYEVGMTVSDYDPLFEGLRARLVPLLQAITSAQESMDEPTLPDSLTFSVNAQEAFCMSVSNNMGFDFQAGRMDASTHPFSAGLWPGDTRFTTRFDEKDPFSCLYAVMHETGHALYEQGLDHDHRFTPRGAAVSLGVHESQSRFWENQIGRTPAFWKVALPWFKEAFPEAPDWDEHTLNRIANRVEKGFIRVEADEITYNLHIMLRYEIEKQLFNGDLTVDELPTAWNTMFKEWFDVDVPEDRLGCLQDIHWSMAAFGYFPTYTLGNLYAAQLLEAMSEDLGDLDALVGSGEWQPMLDWLRPRIHQRGSQVSPAQLIEDATGSPPSPEPFLRYVERKYGELYGLN
jgi:carboxypeptidase Taq